MIRRTLVLSSLAAATLTLMSCGGGGKSPATSPLSPAPAPEAQSDGQSDPLGNIPTELPSLPAAPFSSDAGLGGLALNGDLSQSALAIYTIDVDVDTMQATASLKATRHGAANDDLYLLSIDSFLNAGSFSIVGIGATPTTIDLTWKLAHPFPAPNNITGAPNGSTNRADLGVAGQVVLLADVADGTGNTYFTDVVANTGILTNADAYLQPAGLLELTGGIANTFPYQSLIDESLDGLGSRKGISNGGEVTGNFGTDGWTRAEFGATNDGWTGFGVLHQGQTSSRVMSLDRASLASGFSLDVAVLAKYNDPRGGENGAQKKANRLPPETADATKFAYRMPHGALDVERLSFEGESGGFIPNVISASELRFHVTDWDARTTETAAADLSADLAFDTVAVGESGLPQLSVCIPGVLGDTTTVNDWDATNVVDDDSAYGGDAGQDSGRAGDALYFAKLITKGVGTGQTDGTYTGLVRATDVEDGLDPSLTIGLSGELTPLTSNLPRPITFQDFEVANITPNASPTAVVTGPGSPVSSGDGVLTLSVGPYGDLDLDPIDIRFDWNDDSDFGDTGEGFQTLDGTAPDLFNSPIFYNNATAGSLVMDVPYEFTDNVNPSITGTANFTLGANQTPTGSATVLPAGTVLSGAAVGTVSISVTAYGDAEADAITIDIDWNNDLDFADAGETGNNVVGATPVSFPSPLQYNNPTAANQVRTIRYRFNDTLSNGAVSSPTFTLGANRAPVVNSGTVTLAAASLLDPATFALQNNALNVTDPEGDAITYTVRAIPTVGATQTASGIASGALAGYNASPVMGAWLVASSTISFTVFANDPLHATTTGTSVPSSPLVGTVTSCALNMSAVNTTLATLTGASVLRGGVTANQSITGVQIGWTDIAGEAQYAVQRGPWAVGVNPNTVVFSTIGTAAANATSFNDNTIVASGTRYLYRVMPRCTVGGPDTGTPSQLAMIVMQDFETAPVNTSALDTVGISGWLANYYTNTVDVNSPWFYYVNAAASVAPYPAIVLPAPLNGNMDLLAYEWGAAAGGPVEWVTYSPPQLNNKAALGTLTTSVFEMNHAYANGGAATAGYTILTQNQRPTNADITPPANPNNWWWFPVTNGTNYNDTTATTSFTTGYFPNITGAGFGGVVSGTTLFNWGNGNPGGAIAETFSRVDVSASVAASNHDFVFIAFATAANGSREGARVDDLAWIVY